MEIDNGERLLRSARGQWFEDDSWMGSEWEDGVLIFGRRAEVAGTVDARWTVEMTPPSGSGGTEYAGVNARIMDEQGVYYRVVGGMLVALQTDGLPAPNTMCVDRGGCNSHRDRYLRPIADAGE